MTEQRRFPEREADPLSAIPMRTPIIVEGHAAGSHHAVHEVKPTNVKGGTTGLDREPWVFRSSRSRSPSLSDIFEHHESFAEPSTQAERSAAPAKSKPQRNIPYTISAGTVAFLAAFYLLAYTPFIRVAWIESLERYGQSAAFAAQKCAILDMEDSIFRDGSLHPKLVRFGCTMVEPGQRTDRDSQSNHTRPGGRPGRTIPDTDTSTQSESGLWSFP